MYVCLCKGLTEGAIRRMGERGCTDPDTLMSALGLEDEDCCGRCSEHIQDLVQIALSGCPHRSQCPASRPASS